MSYRMRRACRLSGEGEVVEILEGLGVRRAKVVAAGALVEVATLGGGEIHLGDRIAFDLQRMIPLAGMAGPIELEDPLKSDGRNGPFLLVVMYMGRPFGPFNHVFRIALLFASGIGAFVVMRWWFVPTDFGVYGHYRAGALDDNRGRALAYAGQAACIECHGDVAEVRKAGRHANVRCEACHGPLARHASGESDGKPARPDTRPRVHRLPCQNRRQAAGVPAGRRPRARRRRRVHRVPHGHNPAIS